MLKNLRISTKINVIVGFFVVLVICANGFINNEMEKRNAIETSIHNAKHSTIVIRDSLEKDMMEWDTEHIQDTVSIMANNQDAIKKVIIVNRHDEILASTNAEELGTAITKSVGVCGKCHGRYSRETLRSKSLDGEPMVLESDSGLVSIVTPVMNKPSCSEADCHVHPAEDVVLGMIQVDFSLEDVYAGIQRRQIQTLITGLIAIFLITGIIYLSVLILVTKPTRKLVKAMEQVAAGDLTCQAVVYNNDELGKLAAGFNPMVKKLRKLVARDRKRKEYLEGEIVRVQEVIQAAAAGDLSRKFEVRNNDEFGKIGESLNTMTDELSTMIAADKQKNEYLERQVDKLHEVMIASSRGDFSKRYEAEKDDQIGRLGLGLNRMLEDLSCMIESDKQKRSYLEKQVVKLLEHIRFVAGGNFDREFIADRDDEFGKIGKALNGMSRSLKAMIDQIEMMKFEDKRKKEILEEQVTDIQGIVAQAARGDFTRALSVGSSDPIIEELKDNLNVMFRNLCAMISKIGQSSSLVEASSQTLNEIAMKLDRGALEQVEAIEGATGAVDEMSASITDVARRSETVMMISAGAAKQAKSGGETVSRALDGMKGFTDAMVEIQEVMGELQTSAQDIEGIVKVINEFSDQTNLLALNASIEAARAGDYGRGFSVVAKEVSVLAASTAESTREIANMVRKINECVSKATRSTGKGMEVATSSHDQAMVSQQALNDIIEAVDKVSLHVSETVTSLEGQREMSEMITKDMHKVSEISRNSATMARDASSSVEALTSLALELDAIVQQFKVAQRAQESRKEVHLLASSGDVSVSNVTDRRRLIRPVN